MDDFWMRMLMLFVISAVISFVISYLYWRL